MRATVLCHHTVYYSIICLHLSHHAELSAFALERYCETGRHNNNPNLGYVIINRQQIYSTIFVIISACAAALVM